MGGWARLLAAHGSTGLFWWACAESVFFPVPPDVLLVPLVLANPRAWWAYAGLTTVGSCLGALAGYGLGRLGGRNLLRRFFSGGKARRVELFFAGYGAWAVAIGGFTPIPFKIFTVAAGAFRMDLPVFLLSAAASRAARFFLVAFLLERFGDAGVKLFSGPVAWLSLPVIALAFLVYFFWPRRKGGGS